jgi:hypothetical protein
VGPLVSTVYLSGAPVEVSVIQVGVSIEAFGHRIAVREQRITADESVNFPQYLQLISATLDISISDVLRCDHRYGVGPFDEYSEWATAFNEVYKQAKHADHPLPNLHRAAILAQSGATL